MTTFATHLETTWKSPNGEAYSAAFGRRTLITGVNGGHKSAFVEALQLALSGQVDDYLGRSSVKSSALLMSGFNGEPLIKVTLSNNSTGNVEVRQGKLARFGAVADFPLRNIKTALAGDLTREDSAARRAFAGWACADVTAEVIKNAVPKGLRAKFDDIFKAKQKGRTPVEALAEVAKYAGQRHKDVNSELKGAKKVIEELELPASTDFPLAIAQLQGKIEKHEATIKELSEQSAPAPEHKPTVLPPQSQYPHREALVLLNYLEANDQTFCGVCGSDVGEAHLRACASWNNQELAKQAKPVPPTPPTAKANTTATAELIAAHAKTIGELKIEMHDLQKAAKAHNSKRSLEADVDTYKMLKDKCNSMVTQLVKDGATSLVSKVNHYLPEGWCFGLSLDKGLRFGLMRGDKLHAALSGVEWATVTAALAMATQPVNTANIIVMDDRAWDRDTLYEVMRGFAHYTGQVIIATTVLPKAIPNGWTHIDCDVLFTPGAVPTGPVADTDTDTDTTPSTAADTDTDTTSPGHDWTEEQLRAHYKANGKRALNNLHKQLLGHSVKKQWSVEQVIASIMGRELVQPEPKKAAPAAPAPAVRPPAPQPSTVAPPAPEPAQAAPSAPPAPQPTATHGHSPATVQVLEQLGFDTSIINRLTVENAMLIVSMGWVASTVEVDAAGGVTYRHPTAQG